ncbi:irregular chiasm C-roughest protein-like [Centruroides vittatus]|uniref:irregular chiasm C-roughest protein-like n=1 Tax=Centruroides vittatus TaxID=120091 RepID=UPI00350F0756
MDIWLLLSYFVHQSALTPSVERRGGESNGVRLQCWLQCVRVLEFGLYVKSLLGRHGSGIQTFKVDIMSSTCTNPNDVEVNPGETSRLICTVRNRGGECAWLKDGVVVGRINEKYRFQREPADGDCSIDVLNSKLEDDDGMWQCQVTQGSLHDPTLTSGEVRLTVREAPLPPLIEDNTIQIHPGDLLKIRAGESKRLHCVSRRGNPSALLKWFIEDEDITSMSNQTSIKDVDKEKTWQATSVLDYVFNKGHNKNKLKCEALHAAYESGSKEIEINLQILYLPEIRLEGTPINDIVEGSSVSLKCIADANPEASIIWLKSGNSEIYEIKDQIEFNSISRADSADYTCSAKNEIGESEKLTVKIDVKYKPKILQVTPGPETTVALYNATCLECHAEGNPPPRYIWLQKVSSDPVMWQERGHNSTLYIHNVTYAYQGIYKCVASNIINNLEEKVDSNEVILDVTGAPQILRDVAKTQEKVVTEKDEDAFIIIFFCSDPSPQRTFWEWGSQKLDTGKTHEKYIAEPLVPDEIQQDCYQAKLIVQKVDGSDSRKYTLNIENEKGRESHAVALKVREPVLLSVVIGIVVGSIALFIIIIVVVIYLLRAEKWCFNRHREFAPESDSELGHSVKNGRTTNAGAIPPDALYANL